jgi:hypothetical protein
MSEQDRPNRCQAIVRNGQCGRDAQPGSKYCYSHNGGNDLVEANNKRLYNLHKANARLATLSEHEDLKSLRDEISIARILIEDRFNLIKDESDLLSACGTLNSLLLTVERLVQSAHKLELNLGSLLAKPTLLALGNELVAIIIDELKDIPDYENVVNKISERVITVIAKASNDGK